MRTLDEVIKSLEWCIDDSHSDCDGCPYDGEEDGCHYRNLDALHYLLEYQKLKIEPERKKGMWIKEKENDAFSHYSICGYFTVSALSDRHHNFCPNCGADMRGDR